ncbi:Alpha/Beta hydrolase protein [Mycena rosella]|uniref:Alpha/Beta hydrolase protein n=1 Tax=Mycena rosella TaxID=1033263 RepID=A0AAD7GBY8_MYCRO|nr:Alpha/Beta hydrolase protein [Mycena rosella]
MTTQILFAVTPAARPSFLVYPAAFHDRRSSESYSSIFLNSKVEITTSDGVILRCCMFPPDALAALQRYPQAGPSQSMPHKKAPIATVIVFHGNGMDYGDLEPVAEGFLKLGCNVLMVSYRGYVDSEGTPSEKGLRRDAQAALDHVSGDPELSKIPIILYGLSLGGAVATDLASRNPSAISALIIENTFESLPRIVRRWPYIGVFSFLCTQKWDSAAKLPRIPARTPILMLSGGWDHVVPPMHMAALWRISRTRGGVGPVSEKDRFESFAHGGHFGTFECPGYWEKVGEFVSAVTSTTTDGWKGIGVQDLNSQDLNVGLQGEA